MRPTRLCELEFVNMYNTGSKLNPTLMMVSYRTLVPPHPALTLFLGSFGVCK